MKNLLKTPYAYSVYAEVYIVIVGFVMKNVGKPDTPDNFFAPVAALSLFVLSAAVMAFLFIGQPTQLYLDGEKKQAVTFFAKTLASFAIITTLALLIVSITVRI